MAKIRVHELAKELGKENKDIIAALQKAGVEIKSHMSNVEDDVAEKIRNTFGAAVKKAKEDVRMERDPEKTVGKVRRGKAGHTSDG